MNRGPIVAGIDLSLTATGVALIEHRTAALNTVGSKGTGADSYSTSNKRIARLASRILVACTTSSGLLPDLVVMESPSYGSRNGKLHERAGLWWRVFSRFDLMGIPVATVAPTTRAKYLTGDGRSKKDVVMAHAIERYVNRGADRIANDNEADALGLAAMGSRHLLFPIEQVSMPEENLKAMKGAKWPT